MLKMPIKILHLRHLDVKNAKKKGQDGLHYGCVSVAELCDSSIGLHATKHFQKAPGNDSTSK